MKRRLTKFFTVLLTVMLVVGMAPATGSAAYAASWSNRSSISSWFSSLFGNSSNKNTTEQNSNQQEDKEVLSNSTNTLNAESNDTSSQDPLSLTKTITHNSGDNYTIKLETYSTGVVKDKPVVKDVPTDIVLVLDQSSSMANKMSTSYTYTKVYSVRTNNTYYIQVDGEWKTVFYSYYYESWYDDSWNKVTPKTSESDTSDSTVQFYSRSQGETKTRLKALKDAVNTFVGQIEKKAKDSEATYRIAMVGFANGSYVGSNDFSKYENTELFIGSNQYNYGDSSTAAQYSNAFQDMKTASGKDNIQSSINLLAARGATNADLGMDMANKIFEKNPIPEGENRNRVVVMFTDGEPTKWSQFDKGVADGAINNAYTSINTYNASVYTIGVLDGADPTADITNASNTNVNKYMHYVSSNFPNATNLDTPGTEGSILSGFYKKADDAEELKDVFKQISDNIQSGSSQVTLNTSSVLRDVISDDFSLPEGTTADNIVVETAAYNGTKDGEIQWAEPVTFSDADVTIENGKTINVKNFDYQNEYIATVNGQNQGHKLIVKIPVTINRSFGGNNILSNASAGIYPTADALNATVTAESPKGDHPTDYAVAGTEQWINEGETVTLESLIGYVTGDDSFEYRPDGVKNKYVDIVYTIKDKDGNTVGTYTVEHGNTTGTYSTTSTPALDVDTEYTIECKVTPISEATQDAIDSNRAATEETYTATSYVYINGVTRAFVIDFGKPVTYTKEQVFTENQLSSQDKINQIDYKDGTNTYGDLTLNKNDKSITYKLKKFMDGIDTYTFNVANKCTQTVQMMPATSIYYDDSFTAKDGNGIVDGITYTGDWKVAEKEDIGYQDSLQGSDANYGYDSSENIIGNSEGTVHYIDGTNTSAANASITFKGTGIDIYSYVNNTTGKIAVRLYDENGTTLKTKSITTTYQSGELYQVPTITFKDLDYGKYTVKITITKGKIFYLDGIRIYNPSNDVLVEDKYKDDNEYGAKVIYLRDVLAGTNEKGVITKAEGTVFIDKYVKSDGTVVDAHNLAVDSSSPAEEYVNYGCKQAETNIPAGASIKVILDDSYSNVQVGLKTSSEGAQYQINGGDVKDLLSSTDMYYKVTLNDNTFTITNCSNVMIQITSIKAVK